MNGDITSEALRQCQRAYKVVVLTAEDYHDGLAWLRPADANTTRSDRFIMTNCFYIIRTWQKHLPLTSAC